MSIPDDDEPPSGEVPGAEGIEGLFDELAEAAEASRPAATDAAAPTSDPGLGGLGDLLDEQAGSTSADDDLRGLLDDVPLDPGSASGPDEALPAEGPASPVPLDAAASSGGALAAVGEAPSELEADAPAEARSPEADANAGPPSLEPPSAHEPTPPSLEPAPPSLEPAPPSLEPAGPGPGSERAPASLEPPASPAATRAPTRADAPPSGGGLAGLAGDPASPLGGRLLGSLPTMQGPGLFGSATFSELPDAPLDPLPGMDRNQPLISAEESEAIIRAMRAGSLAPASLAPPPSVTPGAPPEARPMVFGAPDELLRRFVEQADRVALELADVLVGALLEQVAVVADTEPAESAVETASIVFEPYVESGTAWDVVVTGQGRPWATVVLGGSLADVVLARRLGAEGTVARPGTRSRAMNALGRRVLAPIAEACVATVASGLTPALGGWGLVPAGSTVVRIALTAPCLRVAVRVRIGDIEDDALVAIYEDALVSRPGGEEAQAETERRMQTSLQDIEVELAALLGETLISVRDLLALEVGSVIRLSGTPDAPVPVTASGTPVLSGMPIVHQGNLAIEVIT